MEGCHLLNAMKAEKYTFLDIFHQLGVAMKFTQPKNEKAKKRKTTKHTHSKEKKEKENFHYFLLHFPLFVIKQQSSATLAISIY